MTTVRAAAVRGMPRANEGFAHGMTGYFEEIGGMTTVRAAAVRGMPRATDEVKCGIAAGL